jgi:putative CocE/NonD family hydrolase
MPLLHPTQIFARLFLLLGLLGVAFPLSAQKKKDILKDPVFLATPRMMEMALQKPHKAKIDKAGVQSWKTTDYKYAKPTYKKVTRTAQYLTMRDGIRIAVDTYLPKGLKTNAKLPTILYQTRYVRSLQIKGFLRWLKPYVTTNVGFEEIQYFVQRGYAVVVVDTRGSGASFGVRKMEFSPDEVADGYEVCDYIVKQPWSNGAIGSTGVSYVGTTAAFLPSTHHPAVKAIIPRSAIFDLYGDVVFPGGVMQGGFLESWRFTTLSLDRNYFYPFTNKANLLNGINPVDADRRRRMRDSAIALHPKNFDFLTAAGETTFRDENYPGAGEVDIYSVHSYMDKINSSNVPFYWISGWYDGAIVRSSPHGFINLNTPQRLRLGPWDHGPEENISPWDPTPNIKIDFDMLLEMQRYFDYHLKGLKDNGVADDPKVSYYCMGEETWHYADNWPPTGFERTKYHLMPNHRLATQLPNIQGNQSEDIQLSAQCRTGGASRYNSQTGLYRLDGPIGYQNWTETSNELWNYSSEQLTQNMEFTGHGLVNLFVSVPDTDATFFVYVQEELPDGRVVYVTEGMFRALHRKVSTDLPAYKTLGPYHSYKKADAMPLVPGEPTLLPFELMPTSYLFRKGSRIRIGLAAMDPDHFSPIVCKATEITVHSDFEHPSHVVLPLKARTDLD